MKNSGLTKICARRTKTDCKDQAFTAYMFYSEIQQRSRHQKFWWDNCQWYFFRSRVVTCYQDKSCELSSRQLLRCSFIAFFSRSIDASRESGRFGRLVNHSKLKPNCDIQVHIDCQHCVTFLASHSISWHYWVISRWRLLRGSRGWSWWPLKT